MDTRGLTDIQLCQQAIIKLDVDARNLLEKLSQRVSILNAIWRYLVALSKAKLKLIDDKVHQLEEIASRIRNPVDKADMATQIAQHKDEMGRNHYRLKTATLEAMQRIEKDQRDELFRISGNDSRTEAAAASIKQSQSNRMRQEASKTTNSLTGLLSKMSDQVKISEDTTTTLVGSSSVLQESEKEFHHMSGTIQSGGRLISKYGRREMTDKFLIALALCLFFGVVFYISESVCFATFGRKSTCRVRVMKSAVFGYCV